MNIFEFVDKKLALETIGGQLFIVAAIVYVLFFRKQYPAIGTWLKKYGLWLAFLMAVGATGASLFYSNVVGFPPCDLCWFQRIFMYPLVVILGLALIKKPARNASHSDAGGDRRIADYGLAVAVSGFVISLYHNFLYYNIGGLSALCDIGGVGVSCMKRYVFEFGYVTIPLMALTAFALIIVFLLFVRSKRIAE